MVFNKKKDFQNSYTKNVTRGSKKNVLSNYLVDYIFVSSVYLSHQNSFSFSQFLVWLWLISIYPLFKFKEHNKYLTSTSRLWFINIFIRWKRLETLSLHNIPFSNEKCAQISNTRDHLYIKLYRDTLHYLLKLYKKNHKNFVTKYK